MIKKLVIFLFVFCSVSNEAFSACSGRAKDPYCISKNNFGLGGDICVYANPDEKNTSAGKYSLLAKEPITDQVAPWIATPDNLMTTGVGKDPACDLDPPAASCKSKRGILKIYVTGSWFPWGSDIHPSAPNQTMPSCGPEPCTKGIGSKDILANDSLCIDGKRVIKGSNDSNIPCEQKDGYGLYGLIALQNGQSMEDPNASPETAKNPSSEFFRTFQLAPLATDEGGQYFILDYSKVCDVVAGAANCKSDSNNRGDDVVLKGKLYFQIKDRHYEDNAGKICLQIVSGVYKPQGFIERVVSYFDELMSETSEGLYKSVIQDTRMIGAIRALLVLYVSLYGLMFMVGLAEAKQQDMIVRLVKVAIISILISDQSWDFFNNYLFSFFTDGAKDIAKVVLDTTLYHNGVQGSPRFILPDDAAALSIYDILVDMLTSAAIHNKILALLFYNGYFWIYVILIYVAIIFIFLGIIKAIVLYFTSIMIVAVLMVTAPIFIVMILFQMTKQMFENWLQQLTAAGMMLIVVSASMSLLVILIQNQIENLFSYAVCKDVWWTFLSQNHWYLDWADVYFWCPKFDSEIDQCITPLNVFAFLFVAVLFDKVMEQIPQLIDALSNAQLGPISRMASGATQTFSRDVMPLLMAAPNYARAGAGKMLSKADDWTFEFGKSINADPSLKKWSARFSKIPGLVGGASKGLDAIDNKLQGSDERPSTTLGGGFRSMAGNAMKEVKNYKEAGVEMENKRSSMLSKLNRGSNDRAREEERAKAKGDDKSKDETSR